MFWNFEIFIFLLFYPLLPKISVENHYKIIFFHSKFNLTSSLIA